MAPSKRPVYGNRKKGGLAKGGSSAPSSVPQTPEPSPPKELVPERSPAPEPGPSHVDRLAQDVPDDWEASSEEEKAPTAEVKESWDDSSEEEGPAPVQTPAPKPTSAPKPAAKTVPTKGLFDWHYRFINACLICIQPMVPPPLPNRKLKVRKSLNRKKTQTRIPQRRATRTRILQKLKQLCSGWPRSARRKLPHGVRRHAKMRWQLEVKTTSVAQFVAF